MHNVNNGMKKGKKIMNKENICRKINVCLAEEI